MPRLIDADATRKNIQNLKMSQITRVKTLERILMMEWCRAEMLKIIDNAPTIDAEPVRHGRWEWHEEWGPPTRLDPPDLYDTYWICSACGTDLLQYLKSHFPDIPSYTECSEEVPPTLERCPSCGAKMDGGKDNDCE